MTGRDRTPSSWPTPIERDDFEDVGSADRAEFPADTRAVWAWLPEAAVPGGRAHWVLLGGASWPSGRDVLARVGADCSREDLKACAAGVLALPIQLTPMVSEWLFAGSAEYVTCPLFAATELQPARWALPSASRVAEGGRRSAPVEPAPGAGRSLRDRFRITRLAAAAANH